MSIKWLGILPIVAPIPNIAFWVTITHFPLPPVHILFYLQSAVGFNEMEAPTTAYKKTTPIEAGES